MYRGIGARRVSSRVVSTILVYIGFFTMLLALGLVLRGWRGAVLMLAPLVTWLSLNALSWRRVCVELTDETLRYEGAAAHRDFELDVAELVAHYRDPTLPGSPLVLITREGREEICEELAPDHANALSRRLGAVGVDAL